MADGAREDEAAPAAETGDHPVEGGDEVRQLISILRRSWHWIAIITAISTAIATVRTLRLDPVYAATTRMQLDRELPDPTAAKAYENTGWIQAEYLNTQIRILESAALAAAASQDAEARRQFGADERDPAVQAAIFRGGVIVAPVKDTYLVDITYQSTVPDRCAPFANALAQAYMEWRSSQLGQRTRLAVEKIGEEAEKLRAKLDLSERALREFLEKNQEPLMERNEQMLADRIAQNDQALSGVQQRRNRLNAEIDALHRVLELNRPLETAPAVAASHLVTQLHEQLSQADLELSTLSERYGDGWPQVRAARARRDQLRILIQQEIETLTARLQNELDAATNEERGLMQRGGQLHQEARDVANRARMYETLRDEVDASRRFYDEFKTRLIDVGWANTVLSNVRIVDRAVDPPYRVGPNHSRNIGVGALMGLALAAAIVLLRERLADRIATVSEASRLLRLPVIGVVPEVRDVPNDQLDLYAVSRPHSVYAEAFRRLRVQLDAVGALPQDGCGVILCSSGVPQEGKTLCAINVAIATAQAGKRTLLIDGDMRGPRVHRAMALPLGPGLVDVLTSKALWGTVIKQTNVPNLTVMTAGKSDENPAELLSRSAAFAELLSRLRPHFDRVIVDTAPAAAVTDATLMAPFTDVTILVVSAKASSRSASKLACTELMRVGAVPRGVIFNHQSASDADYYYGTYYRRYQYTEPDARPPRSEGDSSRVPTG
jgi:polysaccharide biosynthesis transport protein